MWGEEVLKVSSSNRFLENVTAGVFCCILTNPLEPGT